MVSPNELPVRVLDGPHWRILLRPETYEEGLIPSLEECFEIVEQTQLSVRGWDYPHLSRRDSDREYGENWVASWSDFHGHNEYWRFYQSGQFIHLFNVHESANPEWKERLRAGARGRLDRGERSQRDWNNVPGFISVLNFLYTMTEIFEFAARLCEKDIYRTKLTIRVEIRGIKGFVLVMEEVTRAWMDYYATNQENLVHEWQFIPQELLAESTTASLAATRWFFERFGWSNPSEQILRADQENFLKRRF